MEQDDVEAGFVDSKVMGIADLIADALSQPFLSRQALGGLDEPRGDG